MTGWNHLRHAAAIAIATVFMTIAMSTSAFAAVDLADLELTVEGESVLGHTLTAKLSGEGASTAEKYCEYRWYIDGVKVSADKSFTIPIEERYVDAYPICVVSGDKENVEGRDKNAGPDDEIKPIDISKGSVSISPSSPQAGGTITASFSAFSGATSSQSSKVLATCNSGWYEVGSDTKLGSGTSFTIPSDGAGKSYEWRVSADNSPVAYKSNSGKSSAAVAKKEEKKEEKKESKKEEKKETKKEEDTSKKSADEPSKTATSTAEKAEEKPGKKEEKKEKTATTEQAAPSAPAADPDPKTEEVSSPAPVWPWAVGGGAALLAVAGIAFFVVRARSAAAIAAAAGTGASAIIGGAALEALIAEEASRVALILKHDPRKIMVAHDGEDAAQTLIALIQEKTYLIGKDTSFKDILNSEEEVRRFNADFIVLPLKATEPVSSLDGCRSKILEWCPEAKFGYYVEGEQSEARDAELEAAKTAGAIMGYAYQSVDSNDALVRFVLPTFKDNLARNNPYVCIGAAASLLGVPFVGTLLGLYAGGKDIVNTLKAGNINVDDKISIVGDIAGILGVNEIAGVSAFISSLTHAGFDIKERVETENK